MAAVVLSVTAGFALPQGVAAGGGHLAVADTANNQIAVLPIGGLPGAVPVRLGGSAVLKLPAAVAFTPAGDLIVADTHNGDLDRFSPAPGGWAWAGATVPLAGIMPVDVVAGDGGLLVLDGARRRLLWCPVGGAATVLVADPAWRAPTAIAVDGTAVWVADALTNAVHRYDAAGRRTHTVGRLRTPRGLAVDAGRLYVAEADGARVSVFTLAGAYLEAIAVGAGGRLAIDAGRLYVADPAANAVHVVDLAVRPVSLALVLDRSGSMALPSGAASKIERMRAAGELVADLLSPVAANELSVIGFDRTAAVLTPRAKLAPGGSTSIGAGLALGLDRLRAGGLDRPAVLVVTDGQQNAPPAVADVPIPYGMRVFTIGVGLPQFLDVDALRGDLYLTDGADHRLAEFLVQIVGDLTGRQVAVDAFTTVAAGQLVDLPVEISSAEADLAVVLCWDRPGSRFEVTLENPRGAILTGADATWSVRRDRHAMVHFPLRGQAGRWFVRVAADADELLGVAVTVTSAVRLEWAFEIGDEVMVRVGAPAGSGVRVVGGRVEVLPPVTSLRQLRRRYSGVDLDRLGVQADFPAAAHGPVRTIDLVADHASGTATAALPLTGPDGVWQVRARALARCGTAPPSSARRAGRCWSTMDGGKVGHGRSPSWPARSASASSSTSAPACPRRKTPTRSPRRSPPTRGSSTWTTTRSCSCTPALCSPAPPRAPPSTSTPTCTTRPPSSRPPAATHSTCPGRPA